MQARHTTTYILTNISSQPRSSSLTTKNAAHELADDFFTLFNHINHHLYKDVVDEINVMLKDITSDEIKAMIKAISKDKDCNPYFFLKQIIPLLISPLKNAGLLNEARPLIMKQKDIIFASFDHFYQFHVACETLKSSNFFTISNIELLVSNSQYYAKSNQIAFKLSSLQSYELNDQQYIQQLLTDLDKTPQYSHVDDNESIIPRCTII